MIPSWMTPEQVWQWQLCMKLRLHQVHGDAFQEFFASVMSKLHGDDYVPVRAYGRLGDKGCDGYLDSTGALFACYGKLADVSPVVSTLIQKINDDFAKVVANFAGTMKEWYFVHNLMNGLPAEAVQAIKALQVANPELKIGVIGPEGLEKRVFQMQEADLISLFGPVGTAEHSRNMRLDVVAGIIDSILKGFKDDVLPAASPKPVPVDKIEFNKIPLVWRQMLEAAARNSAYVDDYLENTFDPERGTKLALVFKERYQTLKGQELDPDEIMTALYQEITGIGVVAPDRALAAQALIAFLFESCDIFEDDPSKVTA